MKASYKKYYEANKEAICARMRERESQKREARRQHLAYHPEDVEAEREKNRNKYHTWKSNKILKRLNEWLKDDGVNETFKTFIRNHCLANDTYVIFTPKDLATLEAMPKRAAEKALNINPPDSIDGAIATLAEAYKAEAHEGKEATQEQE